MQFGIGLTPYHRWQSVQEMAEVVRTADRLGFDYVSLSDHIVVPKGPEEPAAEWCSRISVYWQRISLL